MPKFKKTLAMTLSAAALCCCLAGCGQEDVSPTQTTPPTQATEATQPTQTTQATEPSATVEPSPMACNYKGLHFDLDISYTTEEDGDKLTFQNDTIQGSVEFGPLSKMTGGFAQTSADYAKYLQQQLQADYEKVWVGSSTGFGFYLVLQDPDETQVRCLYVKDDLAWNICAQSTDAALTEELIWICGRCAIVSEEIPQT